MTNQIKWDLDLSPCEYPNQIRDFYYKNCISQRKNFSSWVDDLNKDFKNEVDWWLLFPSSRNPNYSKLYHYICVIETLKQVVKKGQYLQIVTSSKILCDLIKNNNSNKLQVNLIKKTNSNSKFYTHFLKSFSFQLFLFCFVNFFVKKKIIKEQVFIHTYPNNKIEKVERLFQFKEKKYINKYVLVPSFIVSKNFFFLSKLILKISKKNYVFKEHYLKFSDLIYAFKLIFRLKKFNKKYKKFKKLDLSAVIFSEINNFKNFNTYVIGILNFKFVEKLRFKKIKIKKSLCWYESHELKGWNMGFRKYFPQVKTFGYQGFSPLLPLMNSFPTKNEAKFKVIPETIIITSPKYKKVITEFNKNINIKIGPTLVFRDIFKKFRKKHNIKHLVIFNEIKNTNVQILKWLDYICLNGVENFFYIKIPKILNMSKEISKFKQNKKFYFTDQNLPELLKNSKYVITSGVGFSSTSLEAISYKCRLLIPVVDPLDSIYFQKLNISKKFYKLFLKKSDFLNYFQNRRKLREKDISEYEYNNFKSTYFSKGSEKIFF
ncbi:hypothetical protein IDH12_01765 [Pelagibacterales bacterium SAG-MED29]|nr:hypothetical protein [Pelagibacterales bacterium SAG-MED29]